VRINAHDVATGGEVWEAHLPGNTAQWIAHSSHGILALILAGGETQLMLLDPENGETRASVTLPGPGRLTVMPTLVGDRVFVANRDGRLNFYRADNLQPGEAWDTRVRVPLMIEPHDGDIVLIGPTSAVRFSPESGAQVWRIDMQPGEAITSRRLLRNNLVLVTRGPYGTRVSGFSLKDGKLAFTHDMPRGNEKDRVDLQREAVFDDGFVAVFTDMRMQDDRLSLWGFRLLVLNADGSERFRWEHSAEGRPTMAQLGVIEDYIVLAVNNTTFCFGAK
jgi:hypothetical protein